MLNLSTVDHRSNAETGVSFEIIDRDTKKKTGAVITVLGSDSSQWMSIYDEIQSTYTIAETGQVVKKSWSERNSDSAKMLAAVTIGWTGLAIGEGGKEFAFSYDNAVKMYEQYSFIANQAHAAIHNRELFLVSA